MIFNFIKYQIPIWYYNLKPYADFGYFPTEKQLEENQYFLEKDTRYFSEESRKRDLAWTAFQSGFINKKYEPGLNVWENSQLPIADEYLFLKKNFHKAWVFYVLIIRILTFHNPIKEVLTQLTFSKLFLFLI